MPTRSPPLWTTAAVAGLLAGAGCATAAVKGPGVPPAGEKTRKGKPGAADEASVAERASEVVASVASVDGKRLRLRLAGDARPKRGVSGVLHVGLGVGGFVWMKVGSAKVDAIDGADLTLVVEQPVVPLEELGDVRFRWATAGSSARAARKERERDADCCKGRNECKGKGNCATDANDCAGRNDCKGLGGCRPADC